MSSHSKTTKRVVSRVSKRRKKGKAWHAKFLKMLPKIEQHARFVFWHLPKDQREEAIQETICNCVVAYNRLVKQGRADAATASSLAKYAVAQFRAGRRVGSSLNIQDLTSAYCQKRKQVHVEHLHCWDQKEQQWREMLIEDKNATPADLAASRIDFPAWLKTLSRRDRKMALILSRGESTNRVASLFRISKARVSQIRRELFEAWQIFQGETEISLAEAAG